MPQTVKGVIARSQGRRRSSSSTSSCPTRARARRSWRSRPAGSATPTCTTARAASTTTSRSCSATRRPASSRRSARASPTSRPGDFVILNWRAVCGQCRACRQGQAVVLLRHPQRHAEDDARPTAPSCRPALGIGAFVEKTLVAAGQCTKVDPEADAGRRRPARLRRDGRHRRGHQHRRRRPRRLGRRDRLRRRRQRGHRRRRGWPARRRSSPSTSTTEKLECGHGASAPPTPSTPQRATRSRRSATLTGGFGADVVDRGGRPARDLRAGLLRPRPRRHGGPGRRARRPTMTVELPLIDVFGRGGALKSTWYGDCLPSPRLPDARRPLPAGPASTWTRFVTETDRHRRRRGGLRQDAPRRGAALGGGAVRPCRIAPSRRRADRAGGHLGHVQPRRRHLGRRQQRLDRRRRQRVRRHRRRPRRRRRSWRRRRPAGRRRSCCTHAHNDHINARRRAGRRDRRAGRTCTRDDRVLWDRVYPDDRPTRELADGDVFTVGGVELHGAAHPGPLARAPCCLYAPALGVVFTGDTLFNGGPGATGRSYSDFPTIIDSIRDRLLTLPPTRRWCSPATATPRRSAPRPRTCRSGSPAATEPRPLPLRPGSNASAGSGCCRAARSAACPRDSTSAGSAPVARLALV